MKWETIDRPGYFGKKRNEIETFWTREYGVGNWRLTWQLGEVELEKPLMRAVYTDAYYEYFMKNPESLEWVTTFKDVWDTAETNVRAGFDFDYQETVNNHIHDIAIRIAVARTGKKFKGEKLLRVRWKDSEGYKINPGVIPFHKPELINPEEIKNISEKPIWWEKDTVEDWYQKNKQLQINEKGKEISQRTK